MESLSMIESSCMDSRDVTCFTASIVLSGCVLLATPTPPPSPEPTLLADAHAGGRDVDPRAYPDRGRQRHDAVDVGARISHRRGN